MARKTGTPDDYCNLWLKQNADAKRIADDIEAFDNLSPELRAIVNESPIQISCVHLLAGCTKFGETVMADTLRERLAEWCQTCGSVRGECP